MGKIIQFVVCIDSVRTMVSMASGIHCRPGKVSSAGKLQALCRSPFLGLDELTRNDFPGKDWRLRTVTTASSLFPHSTQDFPARIRSLRQIQPPPDFVNKFIGDCSTLLNDCLCLLSNHTPSMNTVELLQRAYSHKVLNINQLTLCIKSGVPRVPHHYSHEQSVCWDPQTHHRQMEHRPSVPHHCSHE